MAFVLEEKGVTARSDDEDGKEGRYTTVVERQHGLVDEGNFVTVVTVRARKRLTELHSGAVEDF